jgi:hypothetical protein
VNEEIGKMNHRLLIYRILPLALLVIAGCGGNPSESSTPAPKGDITLSPKTSAVVGYVQTRVGSELEPLANTTVRLAEVMRFEEGEKAIFVLEGATSPGDITDEDGYFSIVDLKPGEYVIVVGEVIGKNVIMSESNGNAKVYEAEQDSVLNVGILQVDLNN